MAELKQSRWVKVMEPGDAKPEEKDNVMNISIGEKCCEADAVYTVRNQKKAAQWLLKYLDYANASQVMHEVADRIETEAANAENDLSLNTETWNCQIDKVQENAYKVRFVWMPSEPMTKKKPTRRPRKASVAAKAPAKKAPAKKTTTKKAPAKKTTTKKAPAKKAMGKEEFTAKMLADKAKAEAK